MLRSRVLLVPLSLLLLVSVSCFQSSRFHLDTKLCSTDILAQFFRRGGGALLRHTNKDDLKHPRVTSLEKDDRSTNASQRKSQVAMWVARKSVKDHSVSDNSSTLESNDYTLEYSPNFQRHVVRNKDTLRVIESFLWLDRALEKYPNTTLLSVGNYKQHRYQQCLFSTSRHNSTLCDLVQDDDVTVIVAGGGLNESTAYPVASGDQDDFDANLDRIKEIFLSMLKWYPGQVDKLMEMWPPLRSYPAELLKERLRFLLAPVPDESILHQANITDDVDWPKILDNSHRGAGMSVAQVSHALQVLPEPLLLRLDYNSHAVQEDDSTTGGPNYATSKAAFLYDQTPSFVLQMTHSVLDLWVTGLPNLDKISLAYLHWKGWEWQACRIVLHAFPSCHQCSLEPSWEFSEQRGGRNTATAMRTKQLAPEVLSYLQTRLHLRPWHIHAMFKTHPQLMGYSAVNLKRNLDFIQSALEMRSEDVRAMVLVMPSLLGASIEALQSRIDFWTLRVGLTIPQLRKAVTQKPALLQYSIKKNLDLKFEFFSAELKLDPSTLARMTTMNPEMWGRSLQHFLRPMAQMFISHCHGMTWTDYGQMLSKVPALLRYSCLKLQQKLEFLKKRLGLTTTELSNMVQKNPRILLQSISTSLQPKIEILQSYGGPASLKVLSENPALLVLSKAAFKERIQSIITSPSSGDSFSDALDKRRRRNKIWLISINSKKAVELEFSSVREASKHAGTSQSHMYTILRNKRLVNGRRYVYANTTEETQSDEDSREEEPSEASVFEEITRKYTAGDQKHEPETDSQTAWLEIQTAGRAFPPENTVRGRRRAGGMALQIRSWPPVEWRQICSNVWKGQRVRLLPDGHTLILGYHSTRPSASRCSLYICREALRLAIEWLQHVSLPSAKISIASESNYALNLLQNTSRLMEWGQAPTENKFVFEGPGELYRANPDILYAVARSYYHLVAQDNVESTFKRNVTVRFVPANTSSEPLSRLREGAKVAAKLMYDISVR